MPQPKVVKQFHFHAAHSVPKVEDCQQVHGHTYHLEVEIQGEPRSDGPEEGMVANARRIKSEVNDAVVDALDHAYIAEGSEPIVGPLRRHGYTVIEIGQKTTAENLSHWILQQLVSYTSLPVTRVRLWETDTMWAEAEVDETTDEAGDTFEVEVTDAGVHIPAEALEAARAGRA